MGLCYISLPFKYRLLLSHHSFNFIYITRSRFLIFSCLGLLSRYRWHVRFALVFNFSVLDDVCVFRLSRSLSRLLLGEEESRLNGITETSREIKVPGA